MERDKEPKDLRGAKPLPGDDPETALEKSGSMDRRASTDRPGAEMIDPMVVGAPATGIPQMGAGLAGPAGHATSEGEQVLEQERRGQRARGEIQRG